MTAKTTSSEWTDSRRSTPADWLAEPEHPEPAHDEATQYVPAPVKIQRAVAYAASRGLRVVGPADLEPQPGPTMTLAQWDRLPRATQNRARARAPRPAPVRRRGSRRTTGSGTTSSGEDDPPEPPRVCGCGCGESIAHLGAQARYLNETHRKRAQRERDKADPDRVIEREHARGVVAGLAEPSLLALANCRCNGGHILERDEELGARCLKCGRQRPESAIGIQNRLRLKAVVS